MVGIISECSGCAYSGVKVSNMCIFVSPYTYKYLEKRWRITKACSARGTFPLCGDSSGGFELLKA